MCTLGRGIVCRQLRIKVLSSLKTKRFGGKEDQDLVLVKGVHVTSTPIPPYYSSTLNISLPLIEWKKGMKFYRIERYKIETKESLSSCGKMKKCLLDVGRAYKVPRPQLLLCSFSILKGEDISYEHNGFK